MTETTVRVYPVRSDAEIARARLAADGIRSSIAVDDEGGLNPGFYRDYGVRLIVDEDDLDDAMISLGIERIRLARALAHAMARHAEWSYPSEACGLVLFAGDLPVFVCALTNADDSPSRFTITPDEHHGAMRFARAHGWRVGGVFHSHPRSAAYPSAADLGGGDPEWVHFLIGPVVGGRAELRAYRIDRDVVAEMSVDVAS